MTKRKKVILFVVEGPSEELALGRILTRIYQASSLDSRLHVTHGDVLTAWRFKGIPDDEINPTELADRVKETVLEYLEKPSSKIRWSDLAKIVQITDTDGAFARAEEVGIPLNLGYRNARKSKVAKALVNKGHLTYKKCEVPYRIYYFSQNLEHALYDDPSNHTDDEKIYLARDFARKFGGSIPDFYQLLEEILPTKGYRESWEFIMRDKNSLRRYSNLRIELPDVVE